MSSVASSWVLLGMALLLGALALWVVGAVGWMLFNIIRDGVCNARHPPKEFLDPTFGPITGEKGCWSGWLGHDPKRIHFMVRGGEPAPDPEGLRELGRLVGALPTYEEAARRHASAGKEAKGSLGALEGIGVCGPGEFDLDFADTTHLDGVWTVSFLESKPAGLSYSD
jgi:hypothetical protein